MRPSLRTLTEGQLILLALEKLLALQANLGSWTNEEHAAILHEIKRRVDNQI